jgi:hypothetical protein
MVAAMCCAALLPASLSAQDAFGPYASRGQCESAMKQFRNDFRKNPSSRPLPEVTGSQSNSEFNDWARATFECRKMPNNGWYIVPVGF